MAGLRAIGTHEHDQYMISHHASITLLIVGLKHSICHTGVVYLSTPHHQPIPELSGLDCSTYPKIENAGGRGGSIGARGFWLPTNCSTQNAKQYTCRPVGLPRLRRPETSLPPRLPCTCFSFGPARGPRPVERVVYALDTTESGSSRTSHTQRQCYRDIYEIQEREACFFLASRAKITPPPPETPKTVALQPPQPPQRRPSLNQWFAGASLTPPPPPAFSQRPRASPAP